MDEDEVRRCCVCAVDVLPSAAVVERTHLPPVYMCHVCRRDPKNAVPGGEAALDADRIEADALADLVALRDELADG